MPILLIMEEKRRSKLYGREIKCRAGVAIK